MKTASKLKTFFNASVEAPKYDGHSLVSIAAFKKPKSIPQYLLIAYFLKRVCKTKMLDFRNNDAR